MKFSERRKELYVALQKLMDEEHLFTIPKLSRKSIASMLGTNEKYLHDALKENTGLAFSEYILSLRLRYAYQLLTDPSSDHTIEGISALSGFGSRKTFYRQFHKHYDMSPSQLRSKTKQ